MNEEIDEKKKEEKIIQTEFSGLTNLHARLVQHKNDVFISANIGLSIRTRHAKWKFLHPRPHLTKNSLTNLTLLFFQTRNELRILHSNDAKKVKKQDYFKSLIESFEIPQATRQNHFQAFSLENTMGPRPTALKEIIQVLFFLACMKRKDQKKIGCFQTRDFLLEVEEKWKAK